MPGMPLGMEGMPLGIDGMPLGIPGMPLRPGIAGVPADMAAVCSATAAICLQRSGTVVWVCVAKSARLVDVPFMEMNAAAAQFLGLAGVGSPGWELA